MQGKRGSTPTQEDVLAAIDDLENLYAQCGASGQLADSTFDFTKEELTAKDVEDIQEKVVTQPYKVRKRPAAALENPSQQGPSATSD
mmetsp:Transcript_15925/g.26382  ORF Transcript_15925/g.26382 Transcript_15925/m.26382 type:complete len:87 (+) Transcript_15925:595-855(+)